MLKVTKRFEYGLLAVKFIAIKNDICSAKEIAEHVKTSYEFISKTLQLLTKAGIITSIQGVRGGYRLNKPAGSISLSDIAAALGEPIHVSECCKEHNNCNHLSDCSIKDPMISIHSEVKRIFDEATVEKIMLQK